MTEAKFYVCRVLLYSFPLPWNETIRKKGMWITSISSLWGRQNDTDILENGKNYSNSGHFPECIKGIKFYFTHENIQIS